MIYQPYYTLFCLSVQQSDKIANDNTLITFRSCRNLVKVRWFFGGWLSKNVKEENNIGIEEFRKDLMEDGI